MNFWFAFLADLAFNYEENVGYPTVLVFWNSEIEGNLNIICGCDVMN